MVDMDEFWDQEESLRHVAAPTSMGQKKVCAKGCFPAHKTQRCVTSAESSVRRSLTST